MQKSQPLVGKYIFSTASTKYCSLKDYEKAPRFTAEIVASVYEPGNLDAMKNYVFATGSDGLSLWNVTDGIPEHIKMVHTSYIVCADTKLNRELL